jgi:hypothetical protein
VIYAKITLTFLASRPYPRLRGGDKNKEGETQLPLPDYLYFPHLLHSGRKDDDGVGFGDAVEGA